MQTIPPYPTAPSICIEDIDDRWIQFFEYLALVGQICVVPGQCAIDYMEWFHKRKAITDDRRRRYTKK